MSTNAVSGTSPTISLSSLLGVTTNSFKRVDNDGDTAPISTQSDGQGGGKLYTALLAALTQFVTDHPAGGTPATTPPVTTAPGATTTPVTTTSTGTTTTPGTTGTTGATVTTGTTGTTGTVPTSLAQDLHAFLHDLFKALRQERHSHDDDDGDDRRVQSPAAPSSSSPAPVSTPVTPTTVPTAVTTTSTGTVTTPGVTTPAPAATSPDTPATPAAGAAGTTSAVGSSVAAYGRRGLAAELSALISDLGAGSTGSASHVSSKTLSDLNLAFTRLISDLGGTTAAPKPATTGTPATTTSAGAGTGSSISSGTTSSGGTPPASSSAAPDTSALQAFLTSFLQDLTGSAGPAPSTVGNSVNVTA